MDNYWDRLNYLAGTGNNFLAGGRIPLTAQGIQFFQEGETVQWRSVQSAQNLFTLYSCCSPLAAIINKKANAFISGEIDIVNPSSGKSVRGEHKDWVELFNRPNPVQTRSQFLKQLYTYTMVRGFCYALPIYPVGFNDRPSQIWLLPPWCIDVRPVLNSDPITNLTHPKREIRFTIGGSTTILDESKLIMFTDIDATDIDPYTLLPISRLTTLQYPITNLLGALESRATLIQKRGAIGIFSNDTGKGEVGYVPVTQPEKDEIQRGFSEYGLSRGQSQYIISNANIKWQSTVMSVKDLMLHEEHVSSIADICDTMNYPPYLLGANIKNGTFSNVDEAKKSLYQEGIMPEAKHIFEQINAGFNAPKDKILFTIDYSDIEVLQESEKEASEGRKATNEACLLGFELGTMTLDDCREAQGEERMGAEPFTLYVWEFEKWKTDKGFVVAPPPLGENKQVTQIETPPNNA